MKPNVPGVWDEDTYADRMDWHEAQMLGTRMIRANKKLARWLAAPWASVVDLADASEDMKLLRCPKPLRSHVKALIIQRHQMPRHNLGVQRSVPVMATPAVLHADKYRSSYERRLAAAFDRLGIRYQYETAHLDYRDSTGRWHVYTPDFTLPDLPMTFVEVKGLNGAGTSDSMKMRWVLQRHPIRLLLWDARIIDMVEDMQSANEVMGLLRSTRLAA
jgi:hypothetical protein